MGIAEVLTGQTLLAIVVFATILFIANNSTSKKAELHHWSKNKERLVTGTKAWVSCSVVLYAALFSTLAYTGWSCVSQDFIVGQILANSEAQRLGILPGSKILVNSSKTLNLSSGLVPKFIADENRNLVLHVQSPDGNTRQVTLHSLGGYSNLRDVGILWKTDWHKFNSVLDVLSATNGTLISLYRTVFSSNGLYLGNSSSVITSGALDFDSPMHKSLILFAMFTFFLPLHYVAVLFISNILRISTLFKSPRKVATAS